MRHCFCCCEYIFRKINWHIFSRFFPLVFVISLAIVKTHVEIAFWRVLFSRPGLPFFSFWDLCHLPATCYSCVLFSKQKVAHCVLSFWLVCTMLRSYNSFELFQIEPPARCDFVSSLQTLELVQTKKSLSSHSVRFSTAELNLSSNV